jgi:hypothetical protein
VGTNDRRGRGRKHVRNELILLLLLSLSVCALGVCASHVCRSAHKKHVQRVETWSTEGEMRNEMSTVLTILQCLDDFRIARHALDRAVEGRDEELVFGELAEAADIVHFEIRLRHDDRVEFLCATVQLPVSHQQTLCVCVCLCLIGGKKSLRFMRTNQLNYSTELPQCNPRYCSTIDAIRVEPPLS